MQLPRLLKIAEVAEILQISKTTVYRLIEVGYLPAVRITMASVRVRELDLEKYIQEHLGEAKVRP